MELEISTKISDWSLNVIVREAGGSVRDGLSLLDQIFSFSGDEITDEDVIQVLGLVALAQLLQEIGGSGPGLVVGVRRFTDRVD